MDNESSNFWRLALVVSLILFAALSYYKYENFRGWVDEKCPWIKEQLAKHDIKFENGPSVADAVDGKTADSKPATVAPNATAGSNTAAAPNSTLPNAAAPAAPVTFSTVAQVAANPSSWPKTIRLKKLTVFLAVLNGKEIGKLNAPVGMEVKLIQIAADKLAVAYSPDGKAANAGGAWVQAEDTDLMERVQHVTK